VKPRLLDLFAGAGGASMGYHHAGFDVTGVDLFPQPHYPFRFIQADAIHYLAEHWQEYDVVHASPPCQRWSQMSKCRPEIAEKYPDLIAPTRALLDLTGLPYVLENVPGAPLRPDVTLCGRMFGLKLYRHRVFEANFDIGQPKHPRHLTPGGRAGHWRPGEIISVSGHCSPIALAREAMGIDWMNRHELAESIPPDYTVFVGHMLQDHLMVVAAA